LINAGDFIDGNPNNQGSPFMQLMSVTDSSAAHIDFVKTRLNGVDSTGDSAHTLLPESQAKHSPQSTAEKAKYTFYRYWPWLVGGVGLIIVLGLAVLIFRCCCGTRQRPIRSKFMAGSYKPLHDPAPDSGMDLHTIPPQGAYSDPYYRAGR
jgi:Orthoreovirus membrane fusion protein p10